MLLEVGRTFLDGRWLEYHPRGNRRALGRLLTRTTAEKKVFIVASKQVNNYDLSDKGRTSWTPDTSRSGCGNFCYGNREVPSIDNSTLGANGSGAKTVAVTYHYKIANVAGWANSQEMKTA